MKIYKITEASEYLGRKPGAAGAARETLRVETPDPAGAGPSFTPSKGSSAASAAAGVRLT